MLAIDINGCVNAALKAEHAHYVNLFPYQRLALVLFDFSIESGATKEK